MTERIIGYNLNHVQLAPHPFPGHYEEVVVPAEDPAKGRRLREVIAAIKAIDEELEIPELWEDELLRCEGGTQRKFVYDDLPNIPSTLVFGDFSTDVRSE
jgi:hypothetical protein